MKKLTFILLAVMATFMGQNASAQGKYGADSAECIKYLSYYQEYYKQKNYDSALPNWRKAYAICPATASQNLFVHGSTLMNREINKNRKNAALFQAQVDSLLTLQDQRLEFYPRTAKGVDQKATILNNKGQYMINFRSDDSQYLYDNLTAIINELGSETKGGLLVNNLQAAINLYRDGKLQDDDVINMFAEHGITIKPMICYRTETVTYTREELENYDMYVLFTPTGVSAFKQNFPDFKDKQGDRIMACFGSSTAKAIEAEEWKLQIAAPTPECPSITTAIDRYLAHQAE